LLASQAGVRFTHVPYKGNAAALSDVAAGHVDWMFATVSEVRAFVQGGKVRALGISGRSRDALLPDVPPVSETLPNFEVVGFMGLFAPARLPAPMLARLNAEIRAILGAPEMVERLAALGMKARPSSPEELAARIRNDSALWKSVINAAGIKPD
jgi:tripartite-type tricarboxylate transporter receptor subunit TctC